MADIKHSCDPQTQYGCPCEDRQMLAELLAACKAQHEAIDMLMAQLISKDSSFMPTKSPAWAKLVQGNMAIQKAELR